MSLQEAEASLASGMQSQQGRVQEATTSLTASLRSTHDQARAIHAGVAGQLATSITAQECFNKVGCCAGPRACRA